MSAHEERLRQIVATGCIMRQLYRDDIDAIEAGAKALADTAAIEAGARKMARGPLETGRFVADMPIILADWLEENGASLIRRAVNRLNSQAFSHYVLRGGKAVVVETTKDIDGRPQTEVYLPATESNRWDDTIAALDEYAGVATERSERDV